MVVGQRGSESEGDGGGVRMVVGRRRSENSWERSVYFLSTITSQKFEEIRLWNETMRNVILLHAREAKSVD